MDIATFSKGQFSKDTFVHGDNYLWDNVQGDFDPRRLLSKEAFNSDMLVHIKFSLFSIGYFDIN